MMVACTFAASLPYLTFIAELELEEITDLKGGKAVLVAHISRSVWWFGTAKQPSHPRPPDSEPHPEDVLIGFCE